MKLVSKTFLLTIFTCFYLSGISVAQERLKDQVFQFRAWSGYSFHSVYLLGKTKNAKSAIVGVGLRKAIR